MGRWVYRRPFFRPQRPRVVLTHAAHHVAVRRRVRVARRRFKFIRRRQAVLGIPQVVNNKAGVIRVLRAVGHFRKLMRQRLRAAPPTTPPAEVRVEAPGRGVVSGSGLVRGRITSG